MVGPATKKHSIVAVEMSFYFFASIKYTCEFRNTSFFKNIFQKFLENFDKNSFPSLQIEKTESFLSDFFKSKNIEISPSELKKLELEYSTKELLLLSEEEIETSNKFENFFRSLEIPQELKSKVIFRYFIENFPASDFNCLFNILNNKLKKLNKTKGKVFQIYTYDQCIKNLFCKYTSYLSNSQITSIRDFSYGLVAPNFLSQFKEYMKERILNKGNPVGFVPIFMPKGVFFENIDKMVLHGLNQLSLLDLIKNREAILHYHFDGFDKFTIGSFSFAAPGFSNIFVFILYLFHEKEDKLVDTLVDISKKVVALNNRKFRVHTSETNQTVDVRLSVKVCVDYKAEKLLFEKKDIVLYLFKSGKKRFVNALSVEKENENFYENFCKNPQNYQDIIESLRKTSREIKVDSNIEDVNQECFQVKYVKVTSLNLSTVNAPAFRYCPFGCDAKGSCYNPFSCQYWKKIPQSGCGITALKKFVKDEILKTDKVYANTLLNIIKNCELELKMLQQKNNTLVEEKINQIKSNYEKQIIQSLETIKAKNEKTVVIIFYFFVEKFSIFNQNYFYILYLFQECVGCYFTMKANNPLFYCISKKFCIPKVPGASFAVDTVHKPLRLGGGLLKETAIISRKITGSFDAFNEALEQLKQDCNEKKSVRKMRVDFVKDHKDTGNLAHTSKSSLFIQNAGGNELMHYLKEGVKFSNILYEKMSSKITQGYFDEHFEVTMIDKFEYLINYFESLEELHLPFYEEDQQQFPSVKINDHPELVSGIQYILEKLKGFKLHLEKMKSTNSLQSKIAQYIFFWKEVSGYLANFLHLLIKTAKKGFKDDIWNKEK